MFAYYTLINIISWLALMTLTILVWENGRLPDSDKRLFYFTYLLIALSALAEWLGVLLNGRDGFPRWPLMVIKCADYILTPMTGGALVRQIRMRNRWHSVLNVLLIFNAVFQVIACPLGWTVRIDSHNHYTHGPLYGIYVGVYLSVLAIMVIEFILYGKTFRRQNRLSLYAVLVLIIVGVVAQEVLSGGYRMVYCALTLAAALMFIYYTEFTQLAADDFAAYQRTQLMKDPLTGVLSRYAYKQALADLDSASGVSKDLAAYVIDINWLKEANDTVGHDAGDEMICGAAKCIESVFEGTGRCYRIGGDEFAVFADLDPAHARERTEELMRVTQTWKGTRVKELSISVGCAHSADHPGLTGQELIEAADHEMYAAKEEYYRRFRHDRRRRR
ncbi:MAG: GGDEF domain-containing protein [Blautia sp.]|nr:GGDEF domain-containing protein [Blautia sp.]